MVRLGLLIPLLFFLCPPAQAAIEGSWRGAALCGSWLGLGDRVIKEARLEVRPEGEGVSGLLSIGTMVEQKRLSITRAGDKWLFRARESDLWIDALEPGPSGAPSRPGLAYLSIKLKRPCSDLLLVKGHEGDFHRVCDTILSALAEASEAESLARDLKRNKPRLLEDYDPSKASFAEFIHGERFGWRFADVSPTKADRLFRHAADCAKFYPDGSRVESLGGFLMRRAAGSQWRWNFWKQGPAFDLVVSGADARRLAKTQEGVEKQSHSDMKLIREADDPTSVDIEALIRRRSGDLSALPPAAVRAYLSALEERIMMLRAARHLAEKFGLQDLPKLPDPQSTREEEVEPLSEDQIDALNARRSRKF